MADVQTENGYTKIANQILEAMARTRLSGREWSFLVVIWRLTYGWKGKTEARIPLSVFSKATGVASNDAAKVLANLEKMNLIRKIPTSKGSIISFVKDFDQWSGSASVSAFKKLNPLNDEEICFYADPELNGSGDAPVDNQPVAKSLIGENTTGSAASGSTGDSASGTTGENASGRCLKPLDFMRGSEGLKKGKKVNIYTDPQKTPFKNDEIPFEEIKKTFQNESNGRRNYFVLSAAATNEITRTWNTLVENGAKNPLKAIKAVIAVAMGEMISWMDKNGDRNIPVWFEPHNIFKDEAFARYLSMAKPTKESEAA